MGDTLKYMKLLRKNRVDICPDCQKPVVIVRSGEFECPQCKKVYYNDFGKVRKYLEENPDSSIQDIMIDTGVSRKMIQEYIDYCHLEYSSKSSGYAKCSRCGTPIRCGRICPSCASMMKEGEYDPDTVGSYSFGQVGKPQTTQEGRTRGFVGTKNQSSDPANGKFRYLKSKE